jgi:hypothetical protein
MENRLQMSEEIEDIKKRLFKNKDSEDFYMRRVPSKVVEIFKKYAFDEFCGDYGLAFKSIVEEMLIKPPIYMNLQDQIIEIAEDYNLFKEEVKKKLLLGNTEPALDKPVSSKVERVNGVRMINRKQEENKKGE